MAIPTTQNNLWTDFGGKGFSAKHAEYAERASTDVIGHDLTLTVTNNEITEIGGKPISAVQQIDVPQEDNKLLTSQSGEASWQQLEQSTWGTVITDGTDPLADENGNLIFDENETDLWTTFNGKGFGAERAIADVEGNNIIDTYVKKGEASSVTTSYDAQTKTLTINI